MADEKEGPYKVVGKITGARERPLFLIVRQDRSNNFLVEVVPDAGTAEYARLLCNLLNKDHREKEIERMSEVNHGDYEDSKGYDRRGLPDQDQ